MAKITDYIETTNYILSKDITDIIASEDCLLLLRLYSNMYLNGGKCPTCKNSQIRYYKILKKNGLEMAKKMQKVQNRTCLPAWKGIISVTATGRHWNCDLVSDEDAIYLLKYIPESKFTVLPQSYLDSKSNNNNANTIEIDFTNDMVNACLVEIKDQLKSGVSKNKIRERYKSVSQVDIYKCTQMFVNTLIKKAEEDNQ